jgi:amidase
MTGPIEDYRVISAEKKLQRSNKIPKEWLIDPDSFHDASNVLHVPITCGVLSTVESDITSNHDATALLERLRSGVWSAELCASAFCKRAAIAHQLVSRSANF